jgi:hypothetical protein
MVRSSCPTEQLRRSATMTTATGHTRGNGDVWELPGVLVSTWERGEGEGRSEATGRSCALACPWRVRARSGASWRHGARRVPGAAVLFFDQGEYRRVQGSEVSVKDMVR